MTTFNLIGQEKTMAETMLEAELITEQQLQGALELQEKDGHKIGQILVKQGLMTPEELAITTGLELNVSFVNLKRHQIQAQALEKIPEPIARRYSVLPLSIVDHCLVVAVEDPGDIQLIEDLSAVARMRVEPVIATGGDIQESIDLSYKGVGEIEKQLGQIAPRSLETEAAEAQISAETIAQAPVVRIADILVAQAVKDRASDIHLEPQEDHLRVRYRIDGVLYDRLSLPLTVHPELLSRIKILASMNIAERRRPQDGQFSFKVGRKDIDVRVATSDTSWGEMASLRILDKSFALFNLSELGMQADAITKYRQMLNAPFGMLLISGPTGSGKTTTLYASVRQLNSQECNIITIEDPVEYRFANINQIQVNPRAGIAFATGLRSIMRLDPDVILVGEIRDRETAEIAVQAALTGHLVLSSIHANDSAAVLLRLQDLGVEPFLISSAVIGVVAQRMLRRTCPHCRILTDPSPQERIAYQAEMGEERAEFFYGSGCNSCANTGYLGRTAIFEILTMSEEIRRMVVAGTNADEIRAQAIKQGMGTMQHDGMLKVKEGITTPYEILRTMYSSG